MATSGLAPLPGAVMTNDFSGGLRGLRPPATFFATLRVAEVSQLQLPINGAFEIIAFIPQA